MPLLRVRTPWAFHVAFAGILAIAIVLRAVWSAELGHTGDIGIFLRWMRSILEFGFRDSYANQVDGGSQPNYPPVALLFLGVWAHAIRDVFGISLTEGSTALTMLMKIIANAADLGGAVVVYVALASWKKQAAALVASGVYALHPAMAYNSAVWGQIDALYTVFIVLALLAMASNRPGPSGANVALALMSKVQAVVIGPVFAYWFLRAKPRPKFLSVAAFVTAAFLFVLPFVSPATLRPLAWVYTSAVGQQSHLTSYAYNLWWAFYGDAGPDLPSDLQIWGPLDARTIGIALFAVTCGIALFQMHVKLMTAKNAFDRWKWYSLATAIISWGFFSVEHGSARAIPVSVLRRRHRDAVRFSATRVRLRSCVCALLFQPHGVPALRMARPVLVRALPRFRRMDFIREHRLDGVLARDRPDRRHHSFPTDAHSFFAQAKNRKSTRKLANATCSPSMMAVAAGMTTRRTRVGSMSPKPSLRHSATA